MCCFFTALVFLGPRLGFLVFWLFPYGRLKINTAFAGLNFPFLVSLLGLIFVPWTTLMYVLIFPLNGFDWIWLGLGLAADIVSWVGSFHNRESVPGYSGA